MEANIKTHKVGQTRKEREKGFGVVYPSMHVDSDEMPPIDQLEFGKHYTMIAHVHVPEKTSEKNKNGTRHRARIEFHEVGFEPRKEKKNAANMTDEELEEASKTGKSADK